MKCEVCGVDVTWWHPEYDLTRVPTHVDVEESIRRKGNHYPRVDRSAIPQLGLPRRRDAVSWIQDFQNRGEKLRHRYGIDGTAGDAQDVDHPYHRDEATGVCLVCGLARRWRRHLPEEPR